VAWIRPGDSAGTYCDRPMLSSSTPYHHIDHGGLQTYCSVKGGGSQDADAASHGGSASDDALVVVVVVADAIQ